MTAPTAPQPRDDMVAADHDNPWYSTAERLRRMADAAEAGGPR